MAIIDGTTGNDPNLNGTATADTINGFGGADTMRGFGGGDTINPGAGGSDTIDGGTGSDTLNLAGNFADYTVSYSGANIVLTNGSTVETITGVETIIFAGQTVRIVGSGSELTTIQAAVNAAANGDTILVQGGTYAEQVTIANKTDVTLAAAAGQTVTIAAPATLVQNATSSSGRELHGVVAVVGSTNIVLDGINIDGGGVGDTVSGVNPNFLGVVYRNSSGGLTNVDITGIRQSYEPGTTVSGQPILKAATVGFGVQVNNDATLPFFMTGGTISDCQVVGAVFSFADLDVSGVTVIGGGDQTLRTQNGIQVGNSTGTISGNTITDYGFAGFDPIYNSGIRGFDSTNLVISNNTITGFNDVNTASRLVGIFMDTANSGITITGNTIDHADMAIIGTNLASPGGYTVGNNTITNIDLLDAFYNSSGAVLFTPDDGASTHDVTGSNFNDNLFGGLADDALTGLAGNDWVNGRGGNDRLSGGEGDDRIEGGDGSDTADYSAATGSGVTINLNILAAQLASATQGSDTITGIEHLDGSALNDTLIGDGFNNRFDGQGGNDTLRGGAGADDLTGGTGLDTMTGGAGDDSYFVDQAGDHTIEAAGGGIDSVWASVNWTLGNNIEELYLLGSVVTGNGNGLANSIRGNAATNYLDGKGGADVLYGFDGSDVYRVDASSDVVVEANAAAAGGIDRVHATVTYALSENIERLVLEGVANIAATGNSIGNAIAGNAANNFIDGKAGRDTLTGGGGTDQFLFTTALGSANIDYITDFDVTNDYLRLDDAAFAGLALGYLSAAAFRTGTAAADATDRIIYNSVTGAVYFDADGLGGAAQVQFAKLSTGLALTSADIYVF